MFGDAFEVEGNLFVTNYFRGRIASQRHYEFTLSVSNDQWYLTSTDYSVVDKAGQKKKRRMTIGTQGQDVYGVAYLEPIGGLGDTNRTVQGAVTAGPRPSFDSYLQLVWLAFCSPAYLGNTNAPDALLPPWPLDKYQRNAYFRVAIVASAVPPHLPVSIEFQNPGYALTEAGKRREHEPPYHLGYVAGQYSVTAWTNSGALSFPLGFRLVRYGRKDQATSAEDRDVLAIYCGHLSEIRVPKREYFLPDAASDVAVLDHRFEDRPLGIAQLRYSFGSNGWRAADDPSLTALYQQQRQQALRERSYQPPKSPRWVALALFLLVASAPFLIFMWKRISQPPPAGERESSKE